MKPATWSTRLPTLRSKAANGEDPNFDTSIAVAGIGRSSTATGLFECIKHRNKSRHRSPCKEQLGDVRGIRWRCRRKYGGSRGDICPTRPAPRLRSHDRLTAGLTFTDAAHPASISARFRRHDPKELY